MPIYLGIDGGGTQTTCAVGDDTTVLASAVAGGSNMVRVGEHEARANLHDSIRKACAAARITPDMVDAVVVGIAGASVPPVQEAVATMVRDLVPAEVEVVGDMVIAMEAAFAGLPGVVVISGTGSVAFGRNEAGDAWRAGGWGYAISDEGSGHWIGRSVIGAVMRALDASQTTAVLPGILKVWNLNSVAALIQKANASPPPDFAQLFPAVEEAATAGDPIAQQILTAAATELVSLAGIIFRRLWPEPRPVRVAIGGGVFAHSSLVRRTFWTQLRAQYPCVSLSFRIIEPVAGALWLARRVGAGSGRESHDR